VNTGTTRLLIVVALLAAGAVVLARGFEPTGTPVAAGSGSPSPSPTPTTGPSGPASPTPSTQPSGGLSPNTTGVKFMALNGTSVTGLAATAQSLLEDDGYIAVQDADNSPTQGVAATTVYYRPGEDQAQNEADAQYVADTYFDGASIGRLAPLFDDVAPKSAALVVVVGDDFAQQQAA